MKMKAILLLAMMAVAMLAVSVSAWGQEDAAQGDGGGGSVGASAKGNPVIRPLNPEPGEKITDRTPTIRAKVFERGGGVQLRKKEIRLFLDGNRIDESDFTYRARTDLLTFTPDERLSLGKHTVRIVAGPKRDRTTRSWSFRIVG
jgi:hypothetical protein